MAYQTKQFHFDLETELLLFHKSTPTILHDGAQFEGMPVTLLQTEAIANNDYITGVRPLEIVTLHRMHEGAQFVAQNYQNFDFQSLLALHKIVGNGDALNPGMLRTGMGGVNTHKGLFIPDKVVPEIVEKQFNTIVNNRGLTPENRAAKIFTYLSRSQIFNDTNKRTALLTANVPLLQEGAGVFYIPEPAMDNILHMMGSFYYSNDDRLLVATLKEIAVSDYEGMQSIVSPQKHFKLYKSGKFWVTASLVTFFFGVVALNNSSVSADTLPASGTVSIQGKDGTVYMDAFFIVSS